MSITSNNIIPLDGGYARPIRPNVWYGIGRSHRNGGIGMDNFGLPNLEIEGGEAIAKLGNSIIVGSKEPIINRLSNGKLTAAKSKFGGNTTPAREIIAGKNPNEVNNAQKAYKNRFNLNDDGTKKKAKFGNEPIIMPTKKRYKVSRYEDRPLNNKSTNNTTIEFDNEDNSYALPNIDFIVTKSTKSTKSTQSTKSKNKTTTPVVTRNPVATTNTNPTFTIPTLAYDEELENQRLIHNLPFEEDEYARNNEIVTERKPTTHNTKKPIKVNRHINEDTPSPGFIKQNLEDIISGGSNIGASVISYLINKNMLRNMKEPLAPIPMQYQRLNTDVGQQAKIDANREVLYNTIRTIQDNTNSSSTAVNRLVRARYASMLQENAIRNDSDMKRNELFNKNILNRQEVYNNNVNTYNNYIDRLVEHRNRINDLNSENAQGLITGINSTIQNIINKREQRAAHTRTNLAMMAGYPNLPAERFKALGLWDNNILKMYRELYPLK